MKSKIIKVLLSTSLLSSTLFVEAALLRQGTGRLINLAAKNVCPRLVSKRMITTKSMQTSFAEFVKKFDPYFRSRTSHISFGLVSLGVFGGATLYATSDRDSEFSYKEDCIFCNIIKGEAPGTVVAENDMVIVIKDKFARAAIHYLIIPKKHIVDTSKLPDDKGKMAAAILCMAQELSKRPHCQEFRLVNNNGRRADQTVFHLHFHFLSGFDIYPYKGR